MIIRRKNFPEFLSSFRCHDLLPRSTEIVGVASTGFSFTSFFRTAHEKNTRSSRLRFFRFADDSQFDSNQSKGKQA
jgi:hypothetical protein